MKRVGVKKSWGHASTAARFEQTVQGLTLVFPHQLSRRCPIRADSTLLVYFAAGAAGNGTASVFGAAAGAGAASVFGAAAGASGAGGFWHRMQVLHFTVKTALIHS
ncbi:MAG: hypothetical protein ACLP9L_31285 [Thermoguttaceae bacterium]